VTPAQASPAAASPPATLALLSTRTGVSLVRIDSALRPLRGRTLDVGPYLRGWSFSRDGSRLALGTDETGARVAFVDARRLRMLRRMEVAPAGAIAATAWLGPRLVLAVVVVPTPRVIEVVSVDPVARVVLTRERLEGDLLRYVRTADGFALLLAPPEAIGPARLAVVRPSGAVDVAALDRIRAGSVSGSATTPFTIERPGLAIDPDGRRGYVVASGAELAEVDLDGLGVAYHQLSEPVSLLGRIGAWLEPEAQAKSGDGPVRSARWLGDGVLAVSGVDYAAIPEGGMRMTPAGLRLIDTRSWTARTVDPGAENVWPAGELLLATGTAWDRGVRTRTIGLAAYGLDGKLRFRLYPDRNAWVWHSDDRRAYVSIGGNTWAVIDLASGKVVGRRSTMPVPLTRDGSFG
jgi:hypothetical protein